MRSNNWINLLLFLVAFQCLSQRLSSTTVSYSPEGSWQSGNEGQLCDKFLCTQGNLTWVFKPSDQVFNHKNACEKLVEKGITKIYFHGDSYMRQMYAALLITLNGDYRYGSLANSTLSSSCEYHKQFNEKKCGTRELNHYGVVCDGKVILDPYLNGLSNLNHCSNQEGTVVLWSFGNYKLTRHGRQGVNDPKMYQEYFERDICQVLKQDSTSSVNKYSGTIAKHSCSTWWISTHYRMRAFFDDEHPENVYNYNRGMRQYFDSKGCGEVNYIDVYNFTKQLGENYTSEAAFMTYDSVHWGFEVNLIKAQIILSALLAHD